ncbi:MAG TPA: patatin-like phospholipase family protein [Nitrosomonas sp.]|nr:patatin-like phospholipase family protein [Nitrosomonas sp.]
MVENSINTDEKTKNVSFSQVLEEEKKVLSGYDRSSSKPPGDHENPLSALCLSGGGIRSASFNLGVLQALGKYEQIRNIDYLSVVSGGGYIGAWLSAWIHREAALIEKAKSPKENNQSSTNQKLSDIDPSEKSISEAIQKIEREFLECELPERKPSLNKEPKPITWLRNCSSYLSPKLSLMSGDFLGMIGTILRNMFLNWCIVIPACMAVLLLPYLHLFLLTDHSLIAISEWSLSFLSGLLLLFISIILLFYFKPSVDSDKKTERKVITSEKGIAALIAILFLLSMFFISIGIICNDKINSCPTDNATQQSNKIHGHVTLKDCNKSVDESKSLQKTRDDTISVKIFSWEGEFSAIAYTAFSVPILTLAYLIIGCFFLGIFSKAKCFFNHHTDEYFSRIGGYLLAWSLMIGLLWSLVLFNAYILETVNRWILAAGGLSSALAIYFSFGAKTISSFSSRQNTSFIGYEWYIKLFGPIAIISIIIIISLFQEMVMLTMMDSRPEFPGKVEEIAGYLKNIHERVLYQFDNHWHLFLSLILISLIFPFFVTINRFSLNNFYKNRLVRCFLGASRNDDDRNPHVFTNFDVNDDINLSKLHRQKPYLIINTALNLTDTDKLEILAWQQRKAQSFTLSPQFYGSSVNHLGYLSSQYYQNDPYDKVTLGTAVAISGAAASPNMGYHTSKMISFLLAFFNIRLGWWILNPKKIKSKLWRYKKHPLFLSFNELFSRTNDGRKYVYLSDGGHFENLGLYEMVLRKCQYIIVVDVSCDPNHEFEDLGNAIRKIRLDQNIEIEIDVDAIKNVSTENKDNPEENEKNNSTTTTKTVPHAIGTIHYKNSDSNGNLHCQEGKLLYIKPVLCGDEPVDVKHYHKHRSSFPHEPTTDQFFDEPQFESYRKLGFHIMDNILREKLDNRDQEQKSPIGKFFAGWNKTAT